MHINSVCIAGNQSLCWRKQKRALCDRKSVFMRDKSLDMSILSCLHQDLLGMPRDEVLLFSQALEPSLYTHGDASHACANIKSSYLRVERAFTGNYVYVVCCAILHKHWLPDNRKAGECDEARAQDLETCAWSLIHCPVSIACVAMCREICVMGGV